MKRCTILMKTVLLSISLLTSSLLLAQEYDNSANISVGIVDYFFDAERNQDDEIGFAIGAEYPLTGRWSVASDYFSLDSDVENSTAESEVDYFRVGVNYHLNQINGWQPYAGFGMGILEIEPSVFGPNDVEETAIDLGVGLKRYINDNWLFRGDYKVIFGDERGAHDTALTLGVAYAFGKRAARPAATTATPSTVADSDNDGVPDNRDACSNTPAGMRVDSRGCEIDTDRDGVVDSRDNCPDTPANLAVDNNGCPILEVAQRRQELRVNFDFDRSEVKTQYDSEITDFAEFMDVYGNTNVVIEGHTDNRGSDEYNQALSERRANAVRDELVNENGISANRVSTVGYGEARPVSTNNTDAGRADNRRIEAVISVEVEEQRRR